jgi:hypothetical protein
MQAPKSILAICLFLSSTLHLLAQDGLLDSVDQRPGVISVEVRFPSKTLIEEHQAKIVAELKQNYYLQNGIRVGVGLAGLAVCYALYKNYVIRIYGPQDVLSLSDSQKVDLMYTFLPTKFPDFSSSDNQLEQNIGWIPSIASGTTAVVKGLGILAVQAFSLQFLNKTGAQIFHDNSVEWFSSEKTSLLEIYDELAAMKEFMHVGALKNKSFYITQYQADQYVSSLIRLYNAIVLELEPIIGYVNYKSHEMNLHQNHLYGDAVLGDYLFKRAYDVAQEMYEIRSAYPSYTDNDQRVTAIIKMFDYIELFSLELNSALGSFKRFEKEMHAI